MSTVAEQVGPRKSIIDLYAEGHRYFTGKGNVNVVLARIAAELEVRRIDYVVIGASGMTAPDRLKDLADVQELIRIKKLGPEFAQRLNPYVQDEFIRLSESVHNSGCQTKEQE